MSLRLTSGSGRGALTSGGSAATLKISRSSRGNASMSSAAWRKRSYSRRRRTSSARGSASSSISTGRGSSVRGLISASIAAMSRYSAAMLAEIKSRMLLPRPVEIDDEADPRAELVRRLREYERFRQAAEDIDALPRLERDIFNVAALPPEVSAPRPLPEVSLKDM